ncbi:YrhC family protein [Bacillus rubiinfantis]|uniref:YrhC family protein n=1 Tax=Bacillus rubiinfantis TaxID=1499680 RepID=UPI0005A6BC55|nr:YrhC family protein [Bacillus rubiinfantis]
MQTKAKAVYEKMIDFKRFGIVLLAVGVFFFLGVIIPSVAKSIMESKIMILTSVSFLAVSILFFIQSKICETRLLEMEDSDKYFTN